MDSLISTAARALAAGDPVSALRYVALRDDPPALALRGIAMAQLGELARARRLLQRAARGFGEAEAVARARCVVAEAEVALAARDLPGAARGLDEAVRVLAAHGDAANAVFGRLVEVRRLVLLGRLEAAALALARLPRIELPPSLIAIALLLAADAAARRLQAEAAREALVRAESAALSSRIPALVAEVARARSDLDAPVARLVSAGDAERPLRLDEVEAVLGSGELVVDACRREIRAGSRTVSLVRRPVLFELALALGEQAPADVPREVLIQRAFGARHVNDSHRARLRVEIGRLRAVVGKLAELRAGPTGFALVPARARRVQCLLPPAPGEASALLALLRSGEAWSTSGLAAALGTSQRTVQRALAALESDGRVRSVGRGRARRWVAPPGTGFATTLLLVARGALG